MQLEEAAARHVTRVLRLQAGASIALFNGDGHDYAATIEPKSGRRVTVTVGEPTVNATESPLAVTLWQGLCRGQRMDWILQKATELGVTQIRPVSTQRSVVRLDDARVARRAAHWRGILVGAAEQCGRPTVPEIAAPQSLEDALAEPAPDHAHVVLEPTAQDSLREAVDGENAVTILCGPEGGLSPEEVERCRTQGWHTVRLGPRILRTETAPLVALALLQHLRGDF